MFKILRNFYVILSKFVSICKHKTGLSIRCNHRFLNAVQVTNFNKKKTNRLKICKSKYLFSEQIIYIMFFQRFQTIFKNRYLPFPYFFQCIVLKLCLECPLICKQSNPFIFRILKKKPKTKKYGRSPNVHNFTYVSQCWGRRIICTLKENHGLPRWTHCLLFRPKIEFQI